MHAWRSGIIDLAAEGERDPERLKAATLGWITKQINGPRTVPISSIATPDYSSGETIDVARLKIFDAGRWAIAGCDAFVRSSSHRPQLVALKFPVPWRQMLLGTRAGGPWARFSLARAAATAPRR